MIEGSEFPTQMPGVVSVSFLMPSVFYTASSPTLNGQTDNERKNAHNCHLNDQPRAGWHRDLPPISPVRDVIDRHFAKSVNAEC